jgi:hypothetical protein
MPAGLEMIIVPALLSAVIIISMMMLHFTWPFVVGAGILVALLAGLVLGLLRYEKRMDRETLG